MLLVLGFGWTGWPTEQRMHCSVACSYCISSLAGIVRKVSVVTDASTCGSNHSGGG